MKAANPTLNSGTSVPVFTQTSEILCTIIEARKMQEPTCSTISHLFQTECGSKQEPSMRSAKMGELTAKVKRVMDTIKANHFGILQHS